MNTILPYVYLLNQLKFAVAKKNYFFIIRSTGKIKPLLQLFYKLNIIRRFTFKSSNLCYVFPNYSRINKPIRSIKKHSLLLMRRSLGAATLILETSRGVLTHQNALKLGIGGTLVFIIF
jgi:ribosomal protein S8